MSYSNPDRRIYSFASFDFGGGADETLSISGAKGKQGAIHDFGVQGVLETFNGDTLDPWMSVGEIGDLDKYAEEFTVNPLIDVSMSVRTRYDNGIPADKTAMDLILIAAGQTIAANADIVLALFASTGANLTGQGSPFCIMDWDW